MEQQNKTHNKQKELKRAKTKAIEMEPKLLLQPKQNQQSNKVKEYV